MNASTIFFTLVRLNQSKKYMLKVETEMQSNLKKKQSTRTMSTLFWCLTSYIVRPFLDFFLD